MKKVLIIIAMALVVNSCFKEEDYRIDISYTGEELRYVNCPLGGIGTGNMLINGYGSIRELEIFNRPAMDELPPYMTFFSLYVQQEGEDPVVRIMEREALDEYPNPFGKPRQQLGGIPRFKEAVFHNAYPIINIDLIDDEVPLQVTMEAWSPFIPVDPFNSELPCTIIEWKLTNTNKSATSYSIAFTMGNPLISIDQKGNPSQEGCITRPGSVNGWKSFMFSNSEKDAKLPDRGDFMVSFPQNAELSIPLYHGEWWDDAQLFWNDFSNDGRLVNRADTLINYNGKQDVAGMNIHGILASGESVSIPVLFTWRIPFRELESSQAFGNKKIENAIVKNHYAANFESIEDISAYVIDNLDELKSKTSMFSQAMITSSVHPSVLDAAISNMASLKTNLLMRDETGNLHAFEGLGNDFGCCPGNCTHVWNYAQTMAALFPSLERNVRESSFKNATHSNGYQCFRTVFPLSENWFKNIAADGQMGNIMRVYREWKMSGSNEWLGEIWPEVKLALEYAWKGNGELKRADEWMNNNPVPWDPYKEGVLRGDQHNTYDINFFGPNMMTGSLYLGALKACSEMAIAMNEPQKSVEYALLYEKGSERYMDLLWNGEYFEQEIEVVEGVEIAERLKSPQDENGNVLPKYQYGAGCLSDQLIGQYLAFISDMGYIMDTLVTRTALQSIYTNNFREEMRDFDNVQRIYAANGESGLVTCSWPKGGKPLLPFVYSDEVWTGIEYQVATSLIFADMVDEGLKITESVRERYSGSNRNPFAEIESGRYYARAMASWGVYQAMAGYHYNGVKETMVYEPANEVLPLRYFWSTGSAWGTIEANRARIRLACFHGSLELNKLAFVGNKFFTLKEFIPSHEVEVSYIKGNLELEGTLEILFPTKLKLEEGEAFLMELP